jgi:PAS domain S-box-containing protein
VFRLFREPDFHFSNLHFDQVSQVGVILNMYFRNYNYSKLEKQLLGEENFLHLVVKSNIDYTQFNAKYGKWIHYLELQTDLDAETLLFVRCIRPFMYIANNQLVPKAIADRIPDLALAQHPILFGRIFCLKMIFSKHAEQRASYIDLLQKRLQVEPSARAELLYVPAIHSLLTQEKHLTAFTEKALGYSKEEIFSNHYTTFIRTDYIDVVKEFYEYIPEDNGDYPDLVFPMIKKNGDTIWVTQKVTIKRDKFNKKTGFSVIARDITLIKNLEIEHFERASKIKIHNQVIKDLTSKNSSSSS